MIGLTEAKQHLRVDADDDDAQIAVMIEAAVQHLASIGCNVEADPVPAPLKHAALMLVGYLFDNGAIETDGRLSPVFMRLVAPFREIEL